MTNRTRTISKFRRTAAVVALTAGALTTTTLVAQPASAGNDNPGIGAISNGPARPVLRVVKKTCTGKFASQACADWAAQCKSNGGTAVTDPFVEPGVNVYCVL